MLAVVVLLLPVEEFLVPAGAFIAEQVRMLLDHVILTRQFPFFLLLTALLFIVLPATKQERFFSRGFIEDFLWFLYKNVIFVAIVAVTFVAWLHAFVNEHLAFLTVATLDGWPVWARLLFGLVVADFVFWVQHLVSHKVPLLWKFHKVHHSQRELNFFTNDRVHPVEYGLWHLFQVLPLIFFSFEVPEIYLIAVFYKWQPLLIHANVRTNLGPLKHILVTPQSHRVHHSLRPEHHDRNFGAVLTIWDHLFGTQVRDYEVYPETGIEDDGLPLEQKVKWWMLPLLPFVQILYPFREIGADLRGAWRQRRRSTAGGQIESAVSRADR